MKYEKEFRKDHPETIGETDRSFDMYNYSEWLEEKLDNWISVKERLPDRAMEGESFLCVLDTVNGKWVEVCPLIDPLCSEYEAEDESEKCYFAVNQSTRTVVVGNKITVTHWQPLPEPPK